MALDVPFPLCPAPAQGSQTPIQSAKTLATGTFEEVRLDKTDFQPSLRNDADQETALLRRRPKASDILRDSMTLTAPGFRRGFACFGGKGIETDSVLRCLVGLDNVGLATGAL
jgi:hypothetical protein